MLDDKLESSIGQAKSDKVEHADNRNSAEISFWKLVFC